MTISQFAIKVAMLRGIYPCSVTSWIRSKKRNEQVGGHPNSYHLMGLAVDIVIDDDFVYDSVQFVIDARHVGLQAINEGDHWHLEIQ